MPFILTCIRSRNAYNARARNQTKLSYISRVYKYAVETRISTLDGCAHASSLADCLPSFLFSAGFNCYFTARLICQERDNGNKQPSNMFAH